MTFMLRGLFFRNPLDNNARKGMETIPRKAQRLDNLTSFRYGRWSCPNNTPEIKAEQYIRDTYENVNLLFWRVICLSQKWTCESASVCR